MIIGWPAVRETALAPFNNNVSMPLMHCYCCVLCTYRTLSMFIPNNYMCLYLVKLAAPRCFTRVCPNLV